MALSAGENLSASASCDLSSHTPRGVAAIGSSEMLGASIKSGGEIELPVHRHPRSPNGSSHSVLMQSSPTLPPPHPGSPQRIRSGSDARYPFSGEPGDPQHQPGLHRRRPSEQSSGGIAGITSESGGGESVGSGFEAVMNRTTLLEESMVIGSQDNVAAMATRIRQEQASRSPLQAPLSLQVTLPRGPVHTREWPGDENDLEGRSVSSGSECGGLDAVHAPTPKPVLSETNASMDMFSAEVSEPYLSLGATGSKPDVADNAENRAAERNRLHRRAQRLLRGEDPSGSSSDVGPARPAIVSALHPPPPVGGPSGEAGGATAPSPLAELGVAARPLGNLSWRYHRGRGVIHASHSDWDNLRVPEQNGGGTGNVETATNTLQARRLQTRLRRQGDRGLTRGPTGPGQLSRRAVCLISLPFCCYLLWMIPVLIIAIGWAADSCDRPLQAWLFGFALVMAAFLMFYGGVVAYAMGDHTQDNVDRCWDGLQYTIMAGVIAYCLFGVVLVISTGDCHIIAPPVFRMTSAVIVVFVVLPGFYCGFSCSLRAYRCVSRRSALRRGARRARRVSHVRGRGSAQDGPTAAVGAAADTENTARTPSGYGPPSRPAPAFDSSQPVIGAVARIRPPRADSDLETRLPSRTEWASSSVERESDSVDRGSQDDAE